MIFSLNTSFFPEKTIKKNDPERNMILLRIVCESGMIIFSDFSERIEPQKLVLLIPYVFFRVLRSLHRF